MQAIIKTEGLSYIYGKGTPFESRALNNVDFEAYEGELLGIIGHTGSGKSTFIQHLNGLLKPTKGRVLLSGRDIWADGSDIRQVRFKVGLVFQYPEYQLFEETVFKDIAFGPKNMGLNENEIRARVLEAADFVGLGKDILDKSPFELSGGQKRRAAIAGVIAMQPDVFILDEPTAGLDPAGRDALLANIREYHRAKNSTVILVTHSMEEIARTVDRIVVMNQAGILMTGTPHEVFSSAPQLEAVGLSVPQITKVFMRLKSMGLPINASVYTTEQAVDAVLSLTGGGTHA